MLNPFNILSRFIKSPNEKTLDKLQTIVNKVNLLEKESLKRTDMKFTLSSLQNAIISCILEASSKRSNKTGIRSRHSPAHSLKLLTPYCLP